ncbi:MCP methyltransferase/methylesterase, CheR/CheB with PAS/PAC sensor [Desulfamplus magnetovallimortis]|uniref:MCP methyltransferase/methylesterase, CheR/CheB with PAS/PAC sensor n=1 Tax=Desulfamplus magnetovallimortis TaxID=1246637 RepID=A0A1W1HJ28_9BACT|nr:chemotaxis protein CheB [Desulfamplus magnetovallimortis]SLM32464.1 MCP methyltransferase/methylesterase, CheR/CheB with PAS/PAC sensor [Desulfamplus magnetovallimortis]
MAEQKREKTPKKQLTKHTDRPSHIVGMGASAGGLKALQMFFSNMPPETGMTFVIIQHLSPDYKSMMVELLAKNTQMVVCRAEDGMVMKANHIYLITPRKNITTMGGKLFLAPQQERQGLNLPVDIFFRSLAEDQGERAICVVLSGTGSDGTRGLRAIKAEGGTAFVQDEASAEFDGMPRCAIATGLADFILPPEQMPAQLLKFISHPRISLPEEPLEVIKKEENSFTRLMSMLNKKTRVDFTYYKPATVIRRIERRMGLVQVPGIDEYVTYIHKNPEEISALFKDLLIGVTKFFRDREAFKALAENAIPAIIEAARKRTPAQLRVWDVGSSTGEEVYSVAILIQSYLDTNNLDVDVKIFATDIDQQAIEFAGLGTYPDSIAADVEVEYLSRYFDKMPGGYRVKKSIRQMVIFAVHNIINDPPFTRIDLIVCRNLLIYFQPVLQKKIFHTFNYILHQNGFLLLGNSETVVAVEDTFEDINTKQRLYRHKRHGEMPVPPILPRTTLTRDVTFSSSHAAYENRPDSMVPARNASNEKYYQNLINNMVDTLIVVNETRELVQSFGNTKKFLSIPMGNVSLDILSMLPRELSLAVSSAMQKVRKDKERVVYSNIKINDEDGDVRVNLIVNGISRSDDGKNTFMFMISIDEIIEPCLPTPTATSEIQNSLADERINDLEREVLFTRENLQATIEELQTTNEELQATNEELLAANEELQSTNEELQSVNEELNTVNAEYQNKVLELTELNTDMDHLMSSSDISTIFLDKKLCIRKFTTAVTHELNLLDQDIGRPFTDLNVSMFRNLKKEAAQVIKNGVATEKVIRHGDEWYLQRILPFIHEKDTIEGVVLTLVKITDQKNAEIALDKQHKFMISVIEASPSPTILVNREGKIILVNQCAEKILGMERKRLLRMKINSSKFRFTDLDDKPLFSEEEPMTKILSTGTPLEKYIVHLTREDNTRIVLNINANPVFNAKKNVDGAVFRIDPVAYDL